MQKPLVFVPDNVLTTPAKPVGPVDKKIRTIIKNMKDTLVHARNPRGVGLAAPQIGISLQIFVMKPSDKDLMITCINPAIVHRSEELEEAPGNKKNRPKGGATLEGCLSIKNIWGQVKRAKSVTLAYTDENGKRQEEKFTGFPARIVQHEVDHLAGILYTQRVLEQNGKLYHPVIDDDGAEVLEEFRI